MSSIDPIILGHNQFIGVDHMSQDRAKTRMEQFSDIQRIIEIIDFSSNMDVNGMMLSTHPKTKTIMDAIRSRPELSKKMSFYPLIPYVQGYVKKANEKGMIGLINDVLEPASISNKFKLVLKGGASLLNRDFMSILGTAIDIELLPFKDVNVKAVFLHNVFTDLALSLNSKEVFELFISHVEDNYGVTPAFGTLNFARLVTKFDEWGIHKPLIMASFNKVGFQMNPSREECERCLSEYDVNVLAMSTLAAGYLKPTEAYEYLFSLPNIKSVVAGVSTQEHAQETFNIIRNGFQLQ